MLIKHLDKIPLGYAEWYESCALSENDLSRLREHVSPDEIRYWYARGDYEGSGIMLLLKEGLWYPWHMGHCSCYGPLDNFALGEGYASLDALLASCTPEHQEEIKPLLEL